MRKFHLRLAEWRFGARLADARFYKLICAWCKDPPEAGAIFPLLQDADGESQSDDFSDADDSMIFHTVAASLGAMG